MLRVDGVAYRFMGPSDVGTPNIMNQTSVKVFPTRTVYEFTTNEVELSLAFTTPTFPKDLDYLSRPITYLSYSVRSTDNKKHNVQLYYDNTAEIAVNATDEFVNWKKTQQSTSPKTILSIGTQSQQILKLSGDRVGINWGYAYIGVDDNDASVIAGSVKTRTQFIKSGYVLYITFQ
jgi:hypothetical protein